MLESTDKSFTTGAAAVQKKLGLGDPAKTKGITEKIVSDDPVAHNAH
jgi:hypothetical protein